MMNIKEMVGNGRQVHFQFYINKELWYRTETGFEFPVPISDAGTACFKSQDKAILFMRWIRKHMENLKNARNEQSVGL